MFHKLMLNFAWWGNREDAEGRNAFQGGFLGLDNIGVFDRSSALPTGGHIDQSDGTAWMGMYCLNLLTIALELARENRSYEDIASKFFEHFLYIAQAMSNRGGEIDLWDEDDEFFYDVLHLPDETHQALKVRSLVGLIPLLAVETMEPDLLELLPDFKQRLEWFLEHRPHLSALVSRWYEPGTGDRRLLALVRGHRMKRLLVRMLDPNEFLSDYGVRSVSKVHEQHPYVFDCAGSRYQVDYEPGESTSSLFGGNSNWRGPIWFPINFLLIEALQKFHHYYGDDFLVEYPTGSGEQLTLWQIAEALSCRLTHIFKRDADGRRPVSATTSSSRPIRTGATTCRSTSISMATTAGASAPATRPAGPPWWPSSSNKRAAVMFPSSAPSPSPTPPRTRRYSGLWRAAFPWAKAQAEGHCRPEWSPGRATRSTRRVRHRDPCERRTAYDVDPT